jgi:NAD+ synthase (glutamine-hydrolysing)
MLIAGATVNQTPLDWQNNTRHIVDAIEEARRQGARIVCFPELSITGYGCEDLFLHPWVADRAWEELTTIRRYSHNITIAVGLPFRYEDKTYNGVCVIRDNKILGVTLKQFLARDGVHYEPRWFDPWPSGKTAPCKRKDDSFEVGDLVYTTEGIKFGFEICEDAWRKQDRPGYRLAERGVQLILNPSASHFAMGKSLLREQEVVREGSKAFGCAYLFVNLLGNEAGRMIYDGDIVAGQNGELVVVGRRLVFGDYHVVSCTFDFDNPGATRVQPSNDNKDVNEEVAQAVALALFDYMRKSRARGYVLSLSGGADSSMCAVIVAEMVRRASAALGWEKFCEALSLDIRQVNNDWRKAVGMVLTCAYQATKNSSQQTLAAAQSLAESLGAGFHAWNIDDPVDTYTTTLERAIGRQLSWERDDITLQNIQARARSPIIWMLANVKNAVLLTTSNRSEGDVGYATMDGDTSGSLAPIAGLTKTFVLQWLKWAEQTLGHSGLRQVNALQPTAELRPPDQNQTDESDLMPYPVLAQIERLAIYERRPPQEVLDALPDVYTREARVAFVRKFFTLWSRNQWKRERLAPSFHLDEFNVDPRSWCRFPILSSGFAQELEALK